MITSIQSRQTDTHTHPMYNEFAGWTSVFHWACYLLGMPCLWPGQQAHTSKINSNSPTHAHIRESHNFHTKVPRVQQWRRNKKEITDTWALDFPTCFFWKRNCRLRLLTSMVSRSIWKRKKKNKPLCHFDAQHKNIILNDETPSTYMLYASHFTGDPIINKWKQWST